MSHTVELADEIYETIAQQARAEGLSVPEIIVRWAASSDHRQREWALIDKLIKQGKIAKFDESLPPYPRDFQPIDVKGKPLSATIIEERR